MILSEVINELKLQRTKLIKEIEIIDKLLATYNDSIADIPIGDIPLSISTTTDTNIKAKGNKTWEDYCVYVLKQLGGSGKSTDVRIAIEKANINIIKPNRIKSAVRHYLSKLYNNGTLNASVSQSKKEGYVYSIK